VVKRGNARRAVEEGRKEGPGRGRRQERDRTQRAPEEATDRNGDDMVAGKKGRNEGERKAKERRTAAAAERKRQGCHAQLML
jgi:hypothetical protein